MKVSINLVAIYMRLLSQGKTYVTVNELSRMLGISKHAAGKLLAELARMGFVTRWSRRTYKIVASEAAFEVIGRG